MFFSYSILAVDDEPSLSTRTAMQLALMSNFVLGRERNFAGISCAFDQFLGDNASRNDACTWHGIECTDGNVTSINLSSPLGNMFFYKVQLEWLPQSVEFMHFENVNFTSEWSGEVLPRCLKYLCLRNFDKDPTVSFLQDSFNRSLNLRKLPAAMEELIVWLGWCPGLIHIDILPASMRLLVLATSKIRRAIIDMAMLPESIQTLAICNDVLQRGPRIECVSKSSGVLRVQKTYSLDDLENDSKYYVSSVRALQKNFH